MKKFLFVLFLIGFTASAHAGQIGGLAANVDPGGLALSAGISYMIKDVEDGGFEDEITTRAFIVKGSYGIMPNLNLNVKLGFSDLSLDDADYDGRLGSLYGAGLRFKLFKDVEDRVNAYIDGEVSKFLTRDDGVDADVLSYHVAFLITSRAGNVTPYAGIKYSDIDIDFEGTRLDLEADRHVGVFGGMDYFVNPNVYFNGEIHIFDEDLLYIGVGYKF